MSKISQLHAELSEQASQLGFQNIEEAEANGYEVDYEKRTLVDGRELAHENWLQEKERVLQDLQGLLSEFVALADVGSREALYKKHIIENTIDLIKKGEL